MKLPITAGSPLSSANWTWLLEDSYAATQRGINFRESFEEVTESKALEEDDPNNDISPNMLTRSKSNQLSGGLGLNIMDSLLNKGLLMTRFCRPLKFELMHSTSTSYCFDLNLQGPHKLQPIVRHNPL
nr:hypothetical protein Iba_chr05eCG14910 [Ipomoea batatas]